MPTAKSQMSIISWTSPRASDVILPTSRLISVARSLLCSVSNLPKRLTTSARTGAGTLRHCLNAPCARSIAPSTEAAPAQSTENKCWPLMGEFSLMPPAMRLWTTPHRSALACASSLSSLALEIPVGSNAMIFSLGWFRRVELGSPHHLPTDGLRLAMVPRRNRLASLNGLRPNHDEDLAHSGRRPDAHLALRLLLNL